MHHSRQPARAVSSSVRARARKYNTVSSSYSAVQLDEPTTINSSTGSSNVANLADISLMPSPVYEPSWLRTGRSSMSANVRIPSFLIPCSAGQLMDARYKPRTFSRAASDAAAISPAA